MNSNRIKNKNIDRSIIETNNYKRKKKGMIREDTLAPFETRLENHLDSLNQIRYEKWEEEVYDLTAP